MDHLVVLVKHSVHLYIVFFFFIEDIPLCLIIHKVNKLFIVAVKHNSSILSY